MNVMHKVVKESLRKNRTRTLVTIIGVIMSVALITGVTVFGYSLLHVLTEDALLRYGDWHLSVANVDEAFLDEQTVRSEVAAVGFYEQTGCAALPAGKNGEEQYLYIHAFADETFSLLPLTVFSGRLPQNDSELLLSANIASDARIGWKVGETVTLQINGTDKSYTIVGICAKPRFVTTPTGGYTAITHLEQANDGVMKTALIKLHNPYTIDTYAKSLHYDSVYHTNVLRFLGIWQDPGDSLLIKLMFISGVIVIGIIMVGSVFLIFNAFHISLSERTREIGLLASVGATPAQLRSMVLYEGLYIAAVGIPVGTAVGIGAIYVLISAIAGSFEKMIYLNLPLQMCLSVPILLLAALISLLTILISAYIPARKTAKTPVLECIRQTNEIKLSPRTVKISRLSEKIWGLEGILALKNFKRNKRQYRSIILSLVLSIVLFISTSSFVDCFLRISEQGEMVTDYDIGFGTQEMSDIELNNLWGLLQSAEGVTDSAMQSVYFLPAKAENGSYMAVVQFIDEKHYQKYLAQWGLDADKLPAVAKRDGDGTSILELPDLFSEKIVPAEINGQAVTLACIEQLTPDVPPYAEKVESFDYTLLILAPLSLQDTLAGDADVFVKGLTFCSENPEESTEEIRGIILGASVTAEYILLNNAAIGNQSNSLVFIAKVFSYTFIIMISLIAVANVFNTISTNIKLRRRELAMIRSVGMSDRSFQRMMRFECVFYGLQAILFGIPISVGLSCLIQKWMMDGIIAADEVWFHMPWFSLVIAIAAVLLIIFVTMMYTVNKLKRENIIDALRDEMT